MKPKTIPISMIAWLLLLAAVAPAAGPVEKQKVLTIGAGEDLMYSENCIMFSAGADKWRIVTRTVQGAKAAFYVYTGGKRQGPFTVLSNSMVGGCGSKHNPCAAYEPPEDSINADFSRFISEENGSTFINFAGKKIGPYSQVMQFAASADGKHFFAVLADTEQDFWLVAADGRRKAVTGMPLALTVSPSGNLAVLKVQGNVNPLRNPEPINTAAGWDQVNFITSDGKKCGPFSGEAVSSGDAWFTKSGAHWLLAAGQQLYVDGAPFRKFPEPVSQCEFWLADDGKTWAYATYEKLEFSDGSSFPYAFEIDWNRGAGQSFLTWVCLENGRDLFLYKRAF